MSLTLINYFSTALMLITAIFLFTKNRSSVNAVIISIFCLVAAITSLFIGLGFDLGNIEMFEQSMIMVRLAGFFSYGMFLSIFRLSLTFPHEKRKPVLDIITLLIWLSLGSIIIFTDLYVAGVSLEDAIFQRIDGEFYIYFTGLSLLLTLSSIVIFLVRRSKLDNDIHKFQVTLITIGTAISSLIGIFISVILPTAFGITKIYPLSGLMGLLMAGSVFYAIITYRMFNISTAIHKTVLFLLITTLVGFVAGGVFSAVHYFLGHLWLFLMIPVYLGLFVLMILLREKIQEKLISLFKRKTEYLDDLEADLDKIDFGEEFDRVLNGVINALSENIGTDKITVITENSIGKMEVVKSTAYISQVDMDSEDEYIKLLVNIRKNVILKSEVITDPRLGPYKSELMNLFIQTGASAIIVFMEGARLIGIIALGEKETMRSYDTYDYEALKAVQPKLFVVMYFLRNIERKSIAVTVDKELKFSEQIISSLMNNVDIPDQSRFDFHFINKFTSGLGGDFVDVVRLGKTKTLLIVGDVAGKGINASMSMIILKSVIRTFLKETGDFKNLVNKINLFIKKNLPRGIFFAGVFIIIDQSKNMLYYINCGVPVIYLYSGNYKSVSEIQGEGKVLGFVKNMNKFIQIKKLNYRTGDVILISTDGILESTSLTGEPFGKERLADCLKNNHLNSSKNILHNIYKEFLNYIAGVINDDITLVGLKIK